MAQRKHGRRVWKAVVSFHMALWKARNLHVLQLLELSVEDTLHLDLSELGWYCRWDTTELGKDQGMDLWKTED